MSDLMLPRFAPALFAFRRAGQSDPVAALRLALRAYFTRQALPDLSPRQLADIGISPTDALTEAARLPWDTNPGPRQNRPGIAGAIHRALERSRTRRLISRLQARELRDFGISPSDAQAEASKRLWQA
jgi:uncharacterized protein YjiS (DUF1127 family)